MSLVLFLREKSSLRILYPLVRDNEAVGDKENTREIVRKPCEAACWNPSGTRIAIAETGGDVSILEHHAWGSNAPAEFKLEEVKEDRLEGSGKRQVKYLDWSPLSTFLVTAHNFVSIETQKAEGIEHPEQDRNILVWDVGTKSSIASFSRRIADRFCWPSIRWTPDESLCLYNDHRGITLLKGKELHTAPPLLFIAFDGLQHIELAPDDFSGGSLPGLPGRQTSADGSGGTGGDEKESFSREKGGGSGSSSQRGGHHDSFEKEKGKKVLFAAFQPVKGTSLKNRPPAVVRIFDLRVDEEAQTAQSILRGGRKGELIDLTAAVALPGGASVSEISTKKKKDKKEKDKAGGEMNGVGGTDGTDVGAGANGEVGGKKEKVEKNGTSEGGAPLLNGLLVPPGGAGEKDVDNLSEHSGAVLSEGEGGAAWLGAEERGKQVKALFERVFPPGSNVSECRLCWSPQGRALIAFTHTEDDAGNQSYYGQTSVACLRIDWLYKEEKMGQSVEGSPRLTEKYINRKGEPVADVQWNPDPKREEFIIIDGHTNAARAVLFDGKNVTEKKQLVVDYRNTIAWSPMGTMVVVGGFGNLKGDLDFFFRDSEKKDMRRVKHMNAHQTVSCLWAPDGKHVSLAVLAPRRRVDNGYKIFDFNGALVAQRPFEELYEVGWKPVPRGVFRDPGRPTLLDTEGDAPHPSQEKAANKYIPPHKKKELEKQEERERGVSNGSSGPSPMIPSMSPSTGGADKEKGGAVPVPLPPSREREEGEKEKADAAEVEKKKEAKEASAKKKGQAMQEQERKEKEMPRREKIAPPPVAGQEKEKGSVTPPGSLPKDKSKEAAQQQKEKDEHGDDKKDEAKAAAGKGVAPAAAAKKEKERAEKEKATTATPTSAGVPLGPLREPALVASTSAGGAPAVKNNAIGSPPLKETPPIQPATLQQQPPINSQQPPLLEAPQNIKPPLTAQSLLAGALSGGPGSFGTASQTGSRNASSNALSSLAPGSVGAPVRPRPAAAIPTAADLAEQKKERTPAYVPAGREKVQAQQQQQPVAHMAPGAPIPSKQPMQPQPQQMPPQTTQQPLRPQQTPLPSATPKPGMPVVAPSPTGSTTSTVQTVQRVHPSAAAPTAAATPTGAPQMQMQQHAQRAAAQAAPGAAVRPQAHQAQAQQGLYTQPSQSGLPSAHQQHAQQQQQQQAGSGAPSHLQAIWARPVPQTQASPYTGTPGAAPGAPTPQQPQQPTRQPASAQPPPYSAGGRPAPQSDQAQQASNDLKQLLGIGGMVQAQQAQAKARMASPMERENSQQGHQASPTTRDPFDHWGGGQNSQARPQLQQYGGMPGQPQQTAQPLQSRPSADSLHSSHSHHHALHGQAVQAGARTPAPMQTQHQGQHPVAQHRQQQQPATHMQQQPLLGQQQQQQQMQRQQAAATAQAHRTAAGQSGQTPAYPQGYYTPQQQQQQQQQQQAQQYYGSYSGGAQQQHHHQAPDYAQQTAPRAAEKAPPPQAASSRVDPMADKCWEYLDPKGQRQGPFVAAQMANWAEHGYFNGDLRVRVIGVMQEFMALNVMFPDKPTRFKVQPRIR
uniref:Eukaryotic translation initiation factor 2A n=1 Tax=Chromera velia CCMP2878 TaxID=1169474 RepID=A0A0G4IAD0_9ALVE|eukprot:Cvel_12504.t1-p1 / transcript=Cvel_12504.t1 / gene=Cvel_12504 / organism=Chromera_velia_CCMP2878 / gene_product=Eukaryotic translation initiation factor 2A, putative / transcript_product=Eukaryotic translation initiation factor 2A, putative / location=Cvel_scaffold820:53329-60978(-) / protein_length=1564 / sequence_SO=supercontig / SO=protein_coding / is_pseudo=false